MACYYQWAWRWIFTGQYLLVMQGLGGVFSFSSLKLRVIFIRVHGAPLNAQGILWSLFYQTEKSVLGLFKNVVK